MSSDSENSLTGLSAEQLFNVAADRGNSNRLRWMAATKLSRKHQVQLVDRLVLDGSDPWWKSMVTLCVPSDSDEMRQRLWEYTASSDAATRRSAVRCLAQLGDESVMPAIQSLTLSADESDQIHALNFWGFLGTERAFVLLREWVADDSRGLAVRVEAARVLLEHGDDGGLPLLREVAAENVTCAYHAACAILHHHDSATGYRLLRRIINDSMHEAAFYAVLHVYSHAGREIGTAGQEIDDIKDLDVSWARAWLDAFIEDM